jgi:5-(carboxyamino)imidazole ribonucleotide mutase
VTTVLGCHNVPIQSKERIMEQALVGILMGSDSDLPVMKGAAEALGHFGVSHTMHILSAHRAPKETAEFAESARAKGYRVLICGAGLAAHLAGVVAASTPLPVIGVPLASEPLKGQDSLLAMVQMPKGIPVATVAIGGAYNAGLLAVQILAVSNPKLQDKMVEFKETLRKAVLAKKV